MESDTITELQKAIQIVKAACVCRDINDSGEPYPHENADGAFALKSLFELLPETKEDA
jgi:hypothetical protein